MGGSSCGLIQENGLRNSMKYLNQDIRFLGRDVNPGLYEYEGDANHSTAAFDIVTVRLVVVAK